MNNYNREVSLLCPLCGNDQFESLDSQFEELIDAPDEIRVRCSDCGNVYTKADIIESNEEKLQIAIDEMKSDIIKDLKRDLKRTLKKWK